MMVGRVGEALIMGFGLVLIGIATIRAHVLRWKSLLFLMGMCGIGVWFVYETAMQPEFANLWLWNVAVQVLVMFFGAGWVLLGYTLWSGKGLRESSRD
jgi:hypothetical protein